MECDRLLKLEMTAKSARTSQQKLTQILLQRAHESWSKELTKRPEILDHWRGTMDAAGDASWIDEHDEHEVVKQTPHEKNQKTKLCAVYVDAAG